MSDVPTFLGEGTREPRVNPHLDGASAHTTAWATAQGMVGAERDPERLVLWDRAGFDARLYGQFAAHVHPDATAPVLDLLSDWYVWLWYLDDALEVVQRRGGLAAADRFLAGVAAHAHAPAGGPAPAPATNPAERGLDDLWPRTVPVTSAAWRRRFEDHLGEVLQEMRVAEVNNHRPRMPNPVEYVDARRGFGGMLFAADLVEPGGGVDLDEALVASRPLRLLRETFADSVALRNDVLSYRKEIEAGEAPSNGVAVLQHFLGCDPLTAARLLGELRDARRRQFDHLVAHDLPALLTDEGVAAGARAAVERWVQSLRDWMAGDLHWARESGRYALAPPAPPAPPAPAEAVTALRGPTGLGTAAARVRPTAPGATSGRAEVV